MSNIRTYNLLVWKWIDKKFDIKWMYLLCFKLEDTAFLLSGAEVIFCIMLFQKPIQIHIYYNYTECFQKKHWHFSKSYITKTGRDLQILVTLYKTVMLAVTDENTTVLPKVQNINWNTWKPIAIYHHFAHFIIFVAVEFFL